MVIGETYISEECFDILRELQAELRSRDISLLATIKPSGDNVMVTCPYHGGGQERKPSAGIKRDTGVFHCFACDTVRSFPEFISNCFGYGGEDYGFKWLLRGYVSGDKEKRGEIPIDCARDNLGQSDAKSDYVSNEELDKYRFFHPYMYKRKLTDPIIDIFDIGYDGTTKCITFPVRDTEGNTLFVARRSVVTKFFNYPSGVAKPLYGVYEYMQCKNRSVATMFGEVDFTQYDSETVYVCESMLDALTCWVYGKFAVALNGLGTDKQYKALSVLPCRQLVLATDNDEAGMMARRILRKRVHNKIIKEVLLPQGKKDINDLTKEEFSALQEIF